MSWLTLTEVHFDNIKFIERFEYKIHWKQLILNHNLPMDVIYKYEHKFDDILIASQKNLDYEYILARANKLPWLRILNRNKFNLPQIEENLKHIKKVVEHYDRQDF
jgi:hypothetical protein